MEKKFLRGSVKKYFDQKGFGFIVDPEGNDYFFHISKVRDNLILEPGQIVDFQAIQTTKGFTAINVRPVNV